MKDGGEKLKEGGRRLGRRNSGMNGERKGKEGKGGMKWSGKDRMV